MNWTQESLKANHEYRRDQLRKLAGHRVERPAGPAGETEPAAKAHPSHWWSRRGGPQAA